MSQPTRRPAAIRGSAGHVSSGRADIGDIDRHVADGIDVAGIGRRTGPRHLWRQRRGVEVVRGEADGVGIGLPGIDIDGRCVDARGQQPVACDRVRRDQSDLRAHTGPAA